MERRAVTIGVYVEGRLVETVRFDRPLVYVGKLGTSTLRLADVNVSRKHAVIERRGDDSWWVTDLGSTNGTLLRGERVTQAELADGDRLTLGTTTLVVGLVREGPSRPVAQAVPVTARAREAAVPVPTPARVAETAPAGPALDVAFFEGETFVAGRTFTSPQEVVIGPSENAHVRIPAAAFGETNRTLARVVDGGFVPELALPGVRGHITHAHGATEELAPWLARNCKDPLREPFRARLVRGPYTLVVTYGEVARVDFSATSASQRPEATHAVLFSVIAHAAMVLAVMSLPEALLYEPRDPHAQRDRTAQAVRVSTLAAAKPQPLAPEVKPREDKTSRVHVRTVAPAASAPTADRRAPVTEPRTRLPTPLAPRHPTADPIASALSGGDRTAAARAAARTTMIATELESPALKALLESNPFAPRMVASLAGDAATGLQFDPFGGTFDPNGRDDLRDPGGPTGPNGPNGPNGPPGPIASDPIRGNPHRPQTPELPWHEPTHTPVIRPEPIRQHGTGLARDVVENYIRRQLGSVKNCYQTRLQANPKLQGRLVLGFVILPSGAVGQPAVTESTLGDAELNACITAKIARWQFPRPDDDGVVEVTYPVLLKTQ